jgi:hypothetical protein
MKKPRLQHYIPRFYLKGFTDPIALQRNGRDVVWVYEKGREPRRSSPNSEAKERDFYSSDEGNSQNLELESWLANLENQVAPIIARLMRDRRQPGNAEREWLALFVGTMQTRTPAGRWLSENRVSRLAMQLIKEAAADPDKFRKFVDENGGLPEEDFDIEHVRGEILSDHHEVLSGSRDLNLLSIAAVGQMVARVLLGMNWQTIDSEGHEFFLTSDDPVIVHALDERSNKLHLRMGVGSPGVNVWFPLCRTLCLRMGKDLEPGYATWVDRGIRYVNKMIAMCAHRWVFASKRSEKIKSLVNRRGGLFNVKTVDLRFEGRKY